VTSPEPQLVRLLRSLVEADIEFVLIGGVAAVLRGSEILTRDIDVVHTTTDENLARLAQVLTDLDARLRGAEEVDVTIDVPFLRSAERFTFATSLGPLDLLVAPDGTDGYADLVRTADEVAIGDVRVLVASIDDLIRMKEAAGRPKDRYALELLEVLREDRDR